MASRRSIAHSNGSSGSDSRAAAAEQAAFDTLIVQARAGCAQSMDRLMEHLSAHLWAELASRRRSNKTGPTQGSSDLVQDTLLRIRERFNMFERDSFTDFKRWARAVLYRRRQEWTRNHLARNDERHKRMIWNELRDRADANLAGESASGPVEQREVADKAYALFQSMKPNEQFVIDLRLLSGLSYKDIAAMTGSTEDAARMAYDRAVARLRASYHRHDK